METWDLVVTNKSIRMPGTIYSARRQDVLSRGLMRSLRQGERRRVGGYTHPVVLPELLGVSAFTGDGNGRDWIGLIRRSEALKDGRSRSGTTERTISREGLVSLP